MYEVYAQIRDSKGMKDSEVAELADIRQGVLSDWKNGKSSPSTKNLQKIAYALNVSTDYILTGKKPKAEHHLKPEIVELSKEIYNNPALQRLLEVARDSSDYDLSMIISILKRLNKTDPFEDIRGRFPS